MKIQPGDPFFPYPWADNIPVVLAMKAMKEGKASGPQQQMVMQALLSVTGYHDMSYRPDNTHDTAFAEGKRFVGSQILKMVNMSNDAIEEAKRRKAKGRG